MVKRFDSLPPRLSLGACLAVLALAVSPALLACGDDSTSTPMDSGVDTGPVDSAADTSADSAPPPDTAPRPDTGTPPPRPGVERWCVDNAAACVCSEPMEDATEGVELLDGHDFADSPDDTECDRHGTFFGVGGSPATSDVTTVAEAEMPPGNEVLRVVEQPGEAANALWLYSTLDAQPGEMRRSYRYHFQVSTDWSGSTGHPTDPCPSGRNKLMQITTGAGSAHQIQERNDGSVCTGPPGDYASLVLTALHPTVDGNYHFTPDVDFSDCWVGVGWCAIEMSISGDLEAGTGLYLQARITTLSDGVVHTTDKVGPFDDAPTFSRTLNGGDLFHGASSNPNSGNGVGTMWISHWLEASWPTDDDQWAGPACEVAGGC